MGEDERRNLASELAKDVAEEKGVLPPPAEQKPDDSKALTIVESEISSSSSSFQFFSSFLPFVLLFIVQFILLF